LRAQASEKKKQVKDKLKIKMSTSREDSVYLAKLAEQAERYEEMVENMKTVASSG
jgi:hypothetical protein